MRALAIATLLSIQAQAQSFIPDDDRSIRVQRVDGKSAIRVQGLNGTCILELPSLQADQRFFYSVQPMGSAGAMIWIWEFTKAVSMGNFESKYWIGTARRIHYIDSKEAQSLIPEDNFQIRFQGAVIEHPTTGILEVGGILGLPRPQNGSILKFEIRRL